MKRDEKLEQAAEALNYAPDYYSGAQDREEQSRIWRRLLAAQAELAVRTAAFFQFSDHAEGCSIDDSPDCSCGYEAAHAAVSDAAMTGVNRIHELTSEAGALRARVDAAERESAALREVVQRMTGWMDLIIRCHSIPHGIQMEMRRELDAAAAALQGEGGADTNV